MTSRPNLVTYHWGWSSWTVLPNYCKMNHISNVGVSPESASSLTLPLTQVSLSVGINLDHPSSRSSRQCSVLRFGCIELQSWGILVEHKGGCIGAGVINKSPAGPVLPFPMPALVQVLSKSLPSDYTKDWDQKAAEPWLGGMLWVCCNELLREPMSHCI